MLYILKVEDNVELIEVKQDHLYVVHSTSLHFLQELIEVDIQTLPEEYLYLPKRYASNYDVYMFKQ
jgi:hypothetical protein